MESGENTLSAATEVDLNVMNNETIQYIKRLQEMLEQYKAREKVPQRIARTREETS